MCAFEYRIDTGMDYSIIFILSVTDLAERFSRLTPPRLLSLALLRSRNITSAAVAAHVRNVKRTAEKIVELLEVAQSEVSVYCGASVGLPRCSP